ncbi:MAG TPA: hypothetical protein VGY30_11475 [Solirubrobacteraceae bacterium]|jgi:hypothetical protein|nr:hypothetical protein [Solirubrobacteraceae bacterium]
MPRFQERLWDELVRDHAAALAYPVAARGPLRSLPIVEERRPALPGLPAGRRWPALPREPALRKQPAPRLGALLRPGRLAATLTALAATVAVVAILSTTGTTPSVAYAVTQNPDGTITVTIGELTGVTGANAQLAKLGVRANVVPVQAGCTARSESLSGIPPSLSMNIAHVQGQGLAIRPDLIPSGDTLVLIAKQVGASVGLSYGLYRGAAPACVAAGEDHAG